jgi:hypothetical protein
MQVVVGAPLYEMDTDGSVPVQAASATSEKPASAEKASTAPSTKAAPSDSHAHDDKHRKPLIKFVGKRDKTQKVPSHSSPAASAPSQTTATSVKPVREGNGVHFTTLKGMALYGRPPLTLKEIEAIESGGATL